MTINSLFDLSERHILVTGGLGLLGSAIVDALMMHGAAVTVLDRLPASNHAQAVQCDLNSVKDIRAAVGEVEEMWGPVDTLINNAATRTETGRFFDSVEDYEPETWSEVLNVNLGAVFWMSQAVGSRMATRGSGCIINTASIYASDMGVDQRIYSALQDRMNAPVAYSASKAGVVGVTRYLATYWASSGIRVNAVAPGGIEAGQPESFQLAYADRVPMARMGKPVDVVGAYVFLASPAASYITGQCLYVDGGLSCW